MLLKETKKTQPEIAKSKADRNRELVLVLLEWSEVRHGHFVMQQAEKYLHIQCGADAYGIDFLLQSKTFWGWWRNQWARRDDAFLFECATEGDLDNLRSYYVHIHRAERLNIRPHRKLMEKSYMKMVQEVIEEARA